MAAQMVTAIPHASAVVDEPAHLTSGYLSLVEGDLTVNREHPPFIKALAALPLLLLHPALPAAQADPKSRTSEDFEFDYSRRFLYKANDADRLLGAARLPIVALTLLGGAVLFFWARALFGDVAALAALALYAFEPNLLAHGRLVTTDMGATVFALAAFACLQRCSGTMSRWAIAAGAALGLALLSRFSSLLLIPLLIAAALTHRRRPALLLVVFLVALVLVNIGYGFTGGLFPLAHAPIGGALKTQPLAAMESSPTLRWTPIPLPRLYVEGLDLARYKNQSVEGPGYLNGGYSSDGWWSYFVAALAMKTTLPFLALAVAGLCLIAATARSSRVSLTYIALPALGLLLLITATTRAQIGLRYALPVIPFLCIAGGVAAAAVSRVTGRWRVPARVAVVALLGWHAWAALAIHPYHLAYFNELWGGPDRGYLHLVDSNLDWGQDLVGVKQFMQDKGLSSINLYYFGTADPEYYGIQRPLRPEPGYYAVSATHLMGVYLPDRDYLAEFRALRPVSSIGHSIFIYELRDIPPGLTRSRHAR
jgi:hypothetical protein